MRHSVYNTFSLCDTRVTFIIQSIKKKLKTDLISDIPFEKRTIAHLGKFKLKPSIGVGVIYLESPTIHPQTTCFQFEKVNSFQNAHLIKS